MSLHPAVGMLISSLSDFLIVAGGCLTTAMVASDSTSMPSAAVIVFSTVTGLVAAARTLKAMLATPPGEGRP